MKRLFVACGVALAVLAFGTSVVLADTVDTLTDLLLKKGLITQQEAGKLKEQAALERAKFKASILDEVGVSREEFEKLQEQVGEEGKPGFLSTKEAWFKLGGELELEYVDTENDAKEPYPHFQIDKVVLQPKVKLSDSFNLDAQIYVTEGKAYLNEIHAKLTGLPANSWLDAGLYERWIKGHHGRKTEGYPLIGTAFYRDDAITITWGGEYEPIYWMLSVGNGFEVDEKQPAEDSSFKIAHDDHSTSDYHGMEYGINLGLKHDFEEAGKIDLLAFYYNDELSDDDFDDGDGGGLVNELPGYAPTDDDKERVGIGAKYKIDNFTFYGAYIDAEDGELDRDGWFLEGSYKFKLKDRKCLTAIEPVIHYGELDVDWVKDPTKAWTWDREKWMLALIADLYKNVKLKTEYYIMDENTGDGDVDNDELLVQLEVKF